MFLKQFNLALSTWRRLSVLDKSSKNFFELFSLKLLTVLSLYMFINV